MPTDSDNSGALSTSTPSGNDVSNLNPNLSNHSTSSAKEQYTTEDYVHGIKEGDRVMLSRAITLIESTRPEHQQTAREIVDRCLPASGDSIRIAITGVPGVGKSSFIETLGMRLVETDHRLAVLTVDPTSERSRGSILGDKTRMGELSARDEAYIRPSPTAGTLGGVARKTRETIVLCEAAGFNTIFVETVGVGQSEVKVHSMVDFFLLLVLAGAGDELQGIKRGIVEMADAIAVNKADGDNVAAAKDARAEYERALRLLAEPESGWEPPVLTCSALTGDGIDEVWSAVESYRQHTHENGFFETQRRRQARHWLYQTIEQRLQEDFFADPDVDDARKEMESAVESGKLSSFAAADRLLEIYRASTKAE